MAQRLTPQQRAAINKVLQRFDFGMAAAIMRVAGWKYAGSGFPGAKHLRETARELLEGVARTGDDYHATGRLRASRACDGSLEVFTLTFEPIEESAEVNYGAYSDEQAA